jgi:hypothetical protein
MTKSFLLASVAASLFPIAVWAQVPATVPVQPVPPAPPAAPTESVPLAPFATGHPGVLPVFGESLRHTTESRTLWAAGPVPFQTASAGRVSPVTDSSIATLRLDAEYRQALDLVQARRYDQAIRVFDRIVEAKLDRSDAALYWKTFSQFRLGQGDQALATIAALRRDHPASRYLADAKVLEADVRRLAGRPVSPDAAADDEIKLLAIQGLAKSADALPLIEGVLAASNSLNVKKRALYVLALSEDTRANDILMRYARGAGNPDLQVEAIQYLGARRSGATGTELREIYASTTDTRIKVAIIDLFRTSGNKVMLFQLYNDKSEPASVRTAIVSRLGGLVTADDVLALYRQETDPDLKMQLLSVLGLKLGVPQLSQIAQSEPNSAVRVRAIRALAGQRTEAASTALIGLYDSQPAPDVRRAVIDVFAGQKNAEALVALAKKESDLDLKRHLVRQLSGMAPTSKAAADYLMEQLK